MGFPSFDHSAVQIDVLHKVYLGGEDVSIETPSSPELDGTRSIV